MYGILTCVRHDGYFWGPFYKNELTLIPALVITSLVKCGINYFPILKFNGETVEVWEWISNFIPHFIMDVITYPW